MYRKTTALLAAACAAPFMTSSAFAFDVPIVNANMNTWFNGALVDGQDVYPRNGTGEDGWRTYNDRNNGAALRLWNPGTIDRSSTQNNQFFDVGNGGLDASGDANGYVLTVRTQNWDYRNASGVGAATVLTQVWHDDWNNRVWNVQDGADPTGSIAGDPRFEWRQNDDGGTFISGTGVVGDPYVFNETTYDGLGDIVSWGGTATRDSESAAQILTTAFDSTSKYVLTSAVGAPAVGDGTAAHNGSSLNAGDRIDPNDGVTVLGTSTRFFNDAPALFFGAEIELLAGGENMNGSSFAGGVYGGTSIVSDGIAAGGLASDTWGSATATYLPNPGTQAAMDALSGELLQIRLTAFEDAANHQNTAVALFDNVVLTEIKAGDANEDDKVSCSDRLLVLANLGNAGGWNDGDFNGDGTVDAADLALLDGNLGYSGTVPYEDLDGDGDVDGVDISAMFSQFNGPGGGTPANPDADLDCDGDLDGVDLSQMFSAFTGPIAPATVPEPTSLALLGLGGLLIGRRRR